MRVLLLASVMFFASAAWPCLFLSPTLLPYNAVVPESGSENVPLNVRIIARSTLSQLPGDLEATLVSDNESHSLSAALDDELLVFTVPQNLTPQTLYTLTLRYVEFGQEIEFESTFTTGLRTDAEGPTSGVLSEGLVEHFPSELYWNPCTDRPQRSTERWAVPFELSAGQDNNVVAGHRIIRTDASGTQTVTALHIGNQPLPTSARFTDAPVGVFTLETFDLAGNTTSDIAFTITPDDIPGCGCSSLRVKRAPVPMAMALLFIGFIFLRRRQPKEDASRSPC